MSFKRSSVVSFFLFFLTFAIALAWVPIVMAYVISGLLEILLVSVFSAPLGLSVDRSGRTRMFGKWVKKHEYAMASGAIIFFSSLIVGFLSSGIVQCW